MSIDEGGHHSQSAKPLPLKGVCFGKKSRIYKCEVSGNIVEVVDGGDGELVCCGVPMMVMTENTLDAAKEKHLPVIGVVDGGVKVEDGNVAHLKRRSIP